MHFIRDLSFALACCRLVVGVQFQFDIEDDGLIGPSRLVDVQDASICTPLVNQGGMYYSIKVGVGAPKKQYLNVVADTGSDVLIIQDCKCQTDGPCTAGANCFDQSKSTTLKLMKGTVTDPSPKTLAGWDYPRSGATREYLNNLNLLQKPKPQKALDAPIDETATTDAEEKEEEEAPQRMGNNAKRRAREAAAKQEGTEGDEKDTPPLTNNQKRIANGVHKANTSTDLELADLEEPEEFPLHLTLSFGSGIIGGYLATDTVTVGKVSVPMQKGFMLMTEAQLDFGATIQGILGLGPNSTLRAEEEKRLDTQYKQQMKEEENETALEQLHANSAGAEYYDIESSVDDIFGELFDNDPFGSSQPEYIEADFEPTSFFEQKASNAGFSMCFNHDSDGTFRISPPIAEQPHTSMGVYHWGIGFNGISIGKQTVPVLFCTGDNMTDGQQTPCGAIPDSGTTLLIGPQDQVDLLLDNVCKGWKRCNDNYTKLEKAVKKAHKELEDWGFDPYEINSFPRTDVLNLIMSDCANWLQSDSDIDKELPPLFFHVEGVGKTRQVLEMPAHSYIFVEDVEELEYETVNVPGYGDVPLGDGKKTGKMKKVCTVGFSSMEYTTANNGPIWIMGTALFYKYEVGYNMRDNTISFTSLKDLTCGSCGGSGTSSRQKYSSLVAGRHVADDSRPKPKLRKLDRSKMRHPKYDTRVPL